MTAHARIKQPDKHTIAFDEFVCSGSHWFLLPASMANQGEVSCPLCSEPASCNEEDIVAEIKDEKKISQ